MADKPLVSAREAATLTGLSEATIRRMARTGALPGVVTIPGAHLYFRRRVLLDWLNGDGDDREVQRDSAFSSPANR